MPSQRRFCYETCHSAIAHGMFVSFLRTLPMELSWAAAMIYVTAAVPTSLHDSPNQISRDRLARCEEKLARLDKASLTRQAQIATSQGQVIALTFSVCTFISVCDAARGKLETMIARNRLLQRNRESFPGHSDIFGRWQYRYRNRRHRTPFPACFPIYKRYCHQLVS